MPIQKKNFLQLLTAILLLCIGFFAPSESSNFNSKKADDYWKEISLDASSLLSLSGQCKNSDQHWLACKQAASALAKHANTNPQDLKIDAKTNFPLLFSQLKLEKFQNHIPSPAIAAAWNAAISAFDPHANLIPFAQQIDRASQVAETFSGIGVKTYSLGDRFRISAIVNDSPAAHAGLSVGDEILAVNGIVTEKIAPEHLYKHLDGKEGSKVQLWLESEGRQKHITLTRKKFLIPFVQSKVIYPPNTSSSANKLGYLSVQHFNKVKICSDIQYAITNLIKQNVHGLVLDLRGNPGGYVREALCAASLFLGEGKVFASFKKIQNPLNILPHEKVEATGKENDSYTLRTTGKKLTNLPLLVLIDGNTASASEMLAAALQDYSRALIKGDQSFGKGLMQSMHMPWKNKNIVLAKTTHKIFRPNGAPLQLLGVSASIGGDNLSSVQTKRTALLREQDLQNAVSPQ